MNILLIEDHPIIVESITKAINDLTFSCFSCDNIQSGKQILESRSIDLIISDIRLKNSTTAFDLLEKLSNDNPIPIIVYTSYVNQWLFLKLRLLGILPRAVIEKTEIPDWKRLISQILSGKSYYSPSALIFMQQMKNDSVLQELINYSSRKWIIFQQIVHGKSDKDIARDCSISKFTANGYRKELYKLTEVSNASSLILIFRDYGYFEIES